MGFSFFNVCKTLNFFFAHTDMSPKTVVHEQVWQSTRPLGNGRLLLCGMALECTRVQEHVLVLGKPQGPYKTGIFEKQVTHSTPFTNE